MPPGRTILRFTFRDVVGSGRDWWLVIKSDGVDLCDFDPGGPVAATVDTDLRTLTACGAATITGHRSCDPAGFASKAPTPGPPCRARAG